MIKKINKNQNLQKLQIFFKNGLLKFENNSITSKSYAVTYNQTLDKVMWLLSLKIPKKRLKKFKNLKIAACIKNCLNLWYLKLKTNRWSKNIFHQLITHP